MKNQNICNFKQQNPLIKRKKIFLAPSGVVETQLTLKQNGENCIRFSKDVRFLSARSTKRQQPNIMLIMAVVVFLVGFVLCMIFV